MFFSDVLRSADAKRKGITLGVKPAAKVVGINWTAFTHGIDQKWIQPQATVYGDDAPNSGQRPTHGFEPGYLNDLKAVFKGNRKGQKIWTPERIAACEKINKKWLGRRVKWS